MTEISPWSLPYVPFPIIAPKHSLPYVCICKIFEHSSSTFSYDSWCDFWRFEEINISCVLVKIISKEEKEPTYRYFAPCLPSEIQLENLESFEELKNLLDAALYIGVYSSTYFYGVLKRPYEIETHDQFQKENGVFKPKPLNSSLHEEIIKMNSKKSHYFFTQKMLSWRIRTLFIYDWLLLQSQPHFNIPRFEEFLQFNPQFSSVSILTQKQNELAWKKGNYTLCIEEGKKELDILESCLGQIYNDKKPIRYLKDERKGILSQVVLKPV